MPAEISPLYSIELNPEPFFLTAPIPFPEIKASNKYENATCELQNHWDLAGIDFVNMYQTEGFGQPLRDFFSEVNEGGKFQLVQLGELVGINDTQILRKVRKTLQLGTGDQLIDTTIWDFSQLEIVQFMVGLIGKRHRNIYARVNNRRTTINQ